MNIIVFDGVEISRAGDDAGHHDVEAAAMVRVGVGHAAQDGDLVSHAGNAGQQFGQHDARHVRTQSA